MYILLLISKYIFILRNQAVHPLVRIILPTFNILCYSKELSTKMNKNTSVTMAAAIAGILTLAVMTIGLHQAFADDGNNQKCCDNNNQKCCDPKNQETTKVAIGGNGGSGGAGGAGGEGGAGGTNLVKDQSVKKADVDQDANGGNSNGGHGGNANGGHADIIDANIK
jgi:hypothetical protein